MRTGSWWGNVNEEDHLEDIGKDGGIILKCIFKKMGWERGLDLSGSGQGQVADSVNSVTSAS